jgi:hypothetical protein
MSSGPNNTQARGKVHLFAVVRYDAEFSHPGGAFTVKEVLPTLDEARTEVERLNDAARGRAVYFWQTTRFYPKGRRVGAETRRRAPALRLVARKQARG